MSPFQARADFTQVNILPLRCFADSLLSKLLLQLLMANIAIISITALDFVILQQSDRNQKIEPMAFSMSPRSMGSTKKIASKP